MFIINIVISLAYLWANIFSTHTISNIILIVALASFLFTITKIENSSNKSTLFLSRAVIMLPMILLFGNIRSLQSVASNSVLIMIILSGIAYDFFWKNREEYGK